MKSKKLIAIIPEKNSKALITKIFLKRKIFLLKNFLIVKIQIIDKVYVSRLQKDVYTTKYDKPKKLRSKNYQHQKH